MQNDQSIDPDSASERLQQCIEKKKLSRSRKKRLSKKLARTISNELDTANIESEEELEVLVLALRRFRIKNKYVKNILINEET